MKFFSPSQFIRGRFPLAILAGILLALSFPNTSLAGFAWIAPGMMLAIALGRTGGECFRIGYVAGLAHYLTSLGWLLRIPYRWHDIPIGPAFGWLALGMFLALYPATFVWLALRARGARGQVSGADAGVNATWLGALQDLGAMNWVTRSAWALLCAVIWVALEMIISRFLGGFPWNLLGASQYQIIPLIQIASFTGIYGVSFLIVWASVSLVCAVSVILQQPQQRSAWVREIILPMTAVGAVYFFGFHQLTAARESDRHLRVTLVQPSIPQTLIWDSDRDFERFQEVLQLSEAALTNETDVLIWPEAATPGLPRYQRDLADPLSDLARNHRVWLIIGADDAEVTTGRTNYFNASFLIGPDGRLMANYHKQSLVIFGEYIPLERWLPFMKWLTPVGGSFTAGDRAVPFVITEPAADPPGEASATNHSTTEVAKRPKAKTSVLICFEDVFPHVARKSVEPDTDFLVNITNDGWFGEGSAQWQQAASAAFRAVENGLPLVRCANTGLTCWFDAHGRLREIFADHTGRIYGAGFMTANIPLLTPGEKRAPTFYREHGDWFGWSCVVIAAAALLRSTVRRQRIYDL